MRLLFLSSFYPPHELGGMEQLCHEVTEHLRQRGHAVWVLTSRHGTRAGTSRENGIMRSLHLQADVDYYHPTDFFLRRTQKERDNARALQRAIDELCPDLMVVWGMWNLSRNLPHWAEEWMPGQVAYYIASTWPIHTDVHEEYWRYPARRSWSEAIKAPLRSLALAKLEREGYPPELGFDHAMCCSRYIRNTLVEAGRLPDSTSVIYNGIDPQPFLGAHCDDRPERNGSLQLVYFGTLVHQKGVHTAVEALGLLKERGMIEDVDLTILGSGHPDYEASLRAQATRLGIHEHIHFAGRVGRDQVPSWLKCFDVFLFTSTGPEAMARTVMEAMAAGLLVIGTQAGGQKEMLLHDVNSLVFQMEDAEGLADQLARVLGEPGLRQRLAQEGQQMILQQFTLQRMVDDVESWLESLIP